jgi:putative hydrolase of the HAD superfamily
MTASRFHILYCDVGGVLGSNGWDSRLRQRIAGHFKVDIEEIEPRHHLVFDSYERGHMGFEDYLRHVFFDVPRAFTLEELRDYSYNQSIAWPDNISFLERMKALNQIRVALISNEGRGLTEHRVRKFQLRQLADFMVFSHCVGYRKPDQEIWRLGLDLAQATPRESIYVDDRKLFVDVAADMGFTALHYISLVDLIGGLRDLRLAV